MQCTSVTVEPIAITDGISRLVVVMGTRSEQRWDLPPLLLPPNYCRQTDIEFNFPPDSTEISR